ncbi:MAG: hypothetical protein ALAOOOJD_03215 [bacterium]|nr:hypothetical protein [bacterium]
MRAHAEPQAIHAVVAEIGPPQHNVRVARHEDITHERQIRLKIQTPPAIVEEIRIHNLIVGIDDNASGFFCRCKNDFARRAFAVPAFYFFLAVVTLQFNLHRHDAVAFALDLHFRHPGAVGLLHFGDGAFFIIDSRRLMQPLLKKPTQLLAADLFADSNKIGLARMLEFPVLIITLQAGGKGGIADHVSQHLVQQIGFCIRIEKHAGRIFILMHGVGNRLILAGSHVHTRKITHQLIDRGQGIQFREHAHVLARTVGIVTQLPIFFFRKIFGKKERQAVCHPAFPHAVAAHDAGIIQPPERKYQIERLAAVQQQHRRLAGFALRGLHNIELRKWIFACIALNIPLHFIKVFPNFFDKISLRLAAPENTDQIR